MPNKILFVEDYAGLLKVLRLTFELEMPDRELFTATDGNTMCCQLRTELPK